MRYLFPLLFLLMGCSNESQPPAMLSYQSGEYITRKQDERRFAVPPPTEQPPPPRPWNTNQLYDINRYHFRCKGCASNPPLTADKATHFDCGGADHHSLPLRNNEEFVYPILIDLLNHIQNETGKPIRITSGHRCPEHNVYIDPSPQNQTSKHLIGAEVDFYIIGLENQPEIALKWIVDYYKNHPKEEYRQFERYDKEDAQTRQRPWYNKEVFVKIFAPSEGRNLDNSHHNSYISIQVRYDEERKQKVVYSWPGAHNSYYRY